MTSQATAKVKPPDATHRRVLIVEDSPMVAQRVSELIRDLPDTEVVGNAPSESSARELIRKLAPHVIVLDLQLKEGTGFGVMRFLESVEQRPAVIVLSSYAMPEYRNRAKQFGVEHFLDKASDFERLPKLVQSITPAF